MGDAVIPNDWLGEYCKYSICWPNSPQWEAVLRGVLTLPARGRHWQETTGTITEAQSVIRETFDYNLHLRGCLMACDDAGLLAIATALEKLARNQCCAGGAGGTSGGSGGAGATQEELLDTVQGDPETEEPPEGFETWEEFFNDKCAVAHDTISKLQQSLLQMGTINLGVMTLDAVSIALTIIITLAMPASAIIAAAALLIAIGGEIVLVTLLSIVNDNEQELICSLYEGDSASGSLDLFHTLLGGFVDSGVSDPIENFAIKQFAKYMVGNEEANRLYRKDLTRVWGTMDCTDCGPCSEVKAWDFTTDLDGWAYSASECSGLNSQGTVSVVAGMPDMVMNATGGGGGLSAVVAKSDPIDIEIKSGHHITIEVSNDGDEIVFIVEAYFTTEECHVWSQYGIAAATPTTIDLDLSEFEGDTLEDIYLYANNSQSGTVLTHISAISVNCG